MWVSLKSSYLEFTELIGCLYSYLSLNWGSFQPFFLKRFPCSFLSLLSFSNYHKVLLVGLMVSHKPFRLCLFYSIIFLSIRLDNFYYIFSGLLILSSACLNLPLSHYSAFFILIIVLLSCMFSSWFLLFLLLFSICYWYFHYVHTSFSCLPSHLLLVLWASLIHFLKSHCLVYLTVGIFQGKFL